MHYWGEGMPCRMVSIFYAKGAFIVYKRLGSALARPSAWSPINMSGNFEILWGAQIVLWLEL